MQRHDEICTECTTDSDLAERIYQFFAEEEKQIPDPPSGFDQMERNVLAAYDLEVYLKNAIGARPEFQPPILTDEAEGKVGIADIVGALMSWNSPHIIITSQTGSGRKNTLKWLFAQTLDSKATFPFYASAEALHREIIRDSDTNDRNDLTQNAFLDFMLGKRRQYQHLMKGINNFVLFIPDVDRDPTAGTQLEKLILKIPASVHLVLTSRSTHVIPPIFLGRFKQYRVSGIEFESALEMVQMLSGQDISEEELRKIHFRDGKWTFLRAQWVAHYLRHSGALPLSVEPLSETEFFEEFLRKAHKLNSAERNFLRWLAHTMHHYQKRFIRKAQIMEVLRDLAERENMDIEAVLNELYHRGILSALNMSDASITAYGFADLYVYDYFLWLSYGQSSQFTPQEFVNQLETELYREAFFKRILLRGEKQYWNSLKKYDYSDNERIKVIQSLADLPPFHSELERLWRAVMVEALEDASKEVRTIAREALRKGESNERERKQRSPNRSEHGRRAERNSQ
jgi:hypothetical protein